MPANDSNAFENELEIEDLLSSYELRIDDLTQFFDGVTSTLPVCGEPGHFHAMGVLFGARCYVRWNFQGRERCIIGLALFLQAIECAGLVDIDWSGGLWLAATHRIGAQQVTLADVQKAALDSFGNGGFSKQLNAYKAALTKPKRVRGKGKKAAAVKISLRVSSETADYWRSTGRGWQTRMVALISRRDAAMLEPPIKRTCSAKGAAKDSISLRIPAISLARWRSTGRGWQTRMVALISRHADMQTLLTEQQQTQAKKR